MGKKKAQGCISEEIKAIVIIFTLVSIVYVVLKSLGSSETELMIYTVLMSLTTTYISPIITSMINSNSFIDIKLYDYQYLQSNNVFDVWAIPDIKQDELIDCTFSKISNIGETMITRIEMIINHNSNNAAPSYVIEYALKGNDSVYLAVYKGKNLLNDIGDITIIDYAGRDTRRNFCGELCKAGDGYVFPDKEVARKSKKNIKKPCYRSGLPPKQLPS